MTRNRSSHMRTRRRAGLLVAALIVLAWINLAIVSAVTAGSDDSRLSKWRFEALRAHANAESAARIAHRLQKDDPSNPFAGVITLPSGATAEIVAAFAPAPDNPGTLVAESAFGEASQSVSFRLSGQP